MRKHSIAAKLGVLLIVVASIAGVGASTAQAWPLDPHVILNGSITCPGLYSDNVQWAWVSASDGESGWASLGSAGRTRGYSFNLWRVPYGQPGTYVTINVGC